MFMHDYGGGEGVWPCDDIADKYFVQSEIVLKQKNNKELFAEYLCHNSSFYSFSWFSTRSNTVCFIKAYNIVFILSVLTTVGSKWVSL